MSETLMQGTLIFTVSVGLRTFMGAVACLTVVMLTAFTVALDVAITTGTEKKHNYMDCHCMQLHELVCNVKRYSLILHHGASLTLFKSARYGVCTSTSHFYLPLLPHLAQSLPPLSRLPHPAPLFSVPS